jgi:hypothetical protein
MDCMTNETFHKDAWAGTQAPNDKRRILEANRIRGRLRRTAGVQEYEGNAAARAASILEPHTTAILTGS